MDRLHAHPHDSADQVDDVSGLGVLAAPVVGVVGDSALLIAGELIPLHHLLEGRFAVDDVEDVLLGDRRVRTANPRRDRAFLGGGPLCGRYMLLCAQSTSHPSWNTSIVLMNTQVFQFEFHGVL